MSVIKTSLSFSSKDLQKEANVPLHFAASSISEERKLKLVKGPNGEPSELMYFDWYHGKISRQSAESLLKSPGDFLVRVSVSKPGEFVVTVLWSGIPMHFMANVIAGDCAPGNLPHLTYQFEDTAFSSVQDLIEFYYIHKKPVTLLSGAVLRKPVCRNTCVSTCSLVSSTVSGSASSINYGICTQNQSGVTPLSMGNSSNSRYIASSRTNSQPELCLMGLHTDTEPHKQFYSLQDIDLQSAFAHPDAPMSNRSPDISYGSGSTGKNIDSALTLPREYRKNELPHLPSTEVASHGLDSSLTLNAPPKPSRVPSFRHKPKRDLPKQNEEICSRDILGQTNVERLTRSPSLETGVFVQEKTTVFEPPLPPSPSSSSFNSYYEEVKRRTIPVLRTDSAELNRNFSFHIGEQKLPNVIKNDNSDVTDSFFALASQAKENSQLVQHSEGQDFPLCDNSADIDDCKASHGPACAKNNEFHRYTSHVTMCGNMVGSCINLDRFSSPLLPNTENRILEPSVLAKTRAILSSRDATSIAKMLSRVDFEVIKVFEKDLGFQVTSGFEYCTLPQGNHLRDDIIERFVNNL